MQLKRGVQFVEKVAKAPNPKSKRRILWAAIRDNPRPFNLMLELPDLLLDVYFGDQYDEQMCESVAPHHYGQPNDEDVDWGPYQTWRDEHIGDSVIDSVFLPNDRARERAYVLWDGDRVKEMGGIRAWGNGLV
ncbi:uncharacterized protein C8A04DRAFT_26012 [Dichotomopilus funicola]|uniref:Uncharacterized protein n=1 Tax=Dichotomopilus funicola TaxID=1934379 RepID=A0AAN6V833_9PEZI|nr:hypothetical protein C8A04DRAFT_26012 [Dichotomopilus funicola]